MTEDSKKAAAADGRVEDNVEDHASNNAASPKSKSKKGTLIRVVLTVVVVALWWWIADMDAAALGAQLGRLPIEVFVVAWLVAMVNVAVGTVRWRVLLAAYGAKRVPPMRQLFHLYYVGMFFNTFVPANVGGDVMRGHVTRKAFDGDAGAYLIVIIERVFGLAGLMMLAGVLLSVGEIESIPVPNWIGFLGVAAAFGAALAPAIGRRIGRFLPGVLGRLAGDLPKIERPALLALVLVFSLVTQSLVAVTGHLLVHSLVPEVTLLESLVIVPVALISMYLPVVAGLGAREASFVGLFGLVGVGEAEATAASLGVFATQVLTALAGGLLLLKFGLPKVGLAKSDSNEQARQDIHMIDEGKKP